MAIIGREPPADIVIPSPEVSTSHAEIRHLEGEWYELRDLGSTNGTFVGGQRIRSARIRLTDRVGLGGTLVDLSAYAHLIGYEAPSSGSTASFPMPVLPQAMPPYAAQQGMPPYVAQPQAMPPYAAQLPMPPPVAPPYPYPPQMGPGMGPDLAVVMASQRSLVGSAFLTMILYWFCWLPGFVMNMMYMGEARRIRQITGRSPSGYGCLIVLLLFNCVLPVIALAVLLVLGLIVLVIALLSGGSIDEVIRGLP